MDVFAEHAVGGMLGLMANALFGANYIIGLDGVNTGIIDGGWINHNYRQFYVQLAYMLAVTCYAFVMSTILAYIINYIPGLHLRASEEAELLGMDDDQLGEFAYDYVEVRRDYLAWTPAKDQPQDDARDAEISQGDRHGISEHGDMLEGRAPSNGTSSGGEQHTGIGGDRHGVMAEKVAEAEK
ncbi:hypothetical protein MMC08_007938 [Hypocenomyce scalaris]|nr:hypothetical protein [Hypocenomyce scalaris]